LDRYLVLQSGPGMTGPALARPLLARAKADPGQGQLKVDRTIGARARASKNEADPAWPDLWTVYTPLIKNRLVQLEELSHVTAGLEELHRCFRREGKGSKNIP
jgi:hypothetical protein